MPSDKTLSGNIITPAVVLYEFDGPQIFVSRMGFVDVLFVKVDDDDDFERYLATYTSDGIIEAVLNGNISVRGAFLHEQCWIVDTDGYLAIRECWLCSRDDLPASYLPDRNVAIRVGFPPLPNSMAQAFAFFGMGFQGEQIDHRSMRFSILKRIIDESHDAARKILSPIYLSGSRSSTFDFTVAQPEFGSLILSIKEPTINLQRAIKKSADSTVKPQVSNIQGEFVAQRSAFFDAMDEIVDEAEKGEISGSLAIERFSVLDQIQNVIPTGEGIIEDAEFSSYASGKTASLLVREEVGARLHRAFKTAEKNPIIEVGRVEIVNARRNSFVLLSSRGRLVTCYIEPESFANLKADPRFRTGARLSVRGLLTRRVLRDMLSVDGTPQLLS
ncbi:hypothetical protein [Mesorhizobium sp. B2-5-7]|uniref:hypothetical protein n=1 Tax=Mesorhizobium sp. B2-5-7 TaxID=2589923 RepID=UPI001126A353|nr:hypothetical protein [Mesorhizobium sp. B2-5-7]TPK18074.1 hypothetical protein FJ543_06200 [Mesorhizobium sp. B2-5-7]